MAIERFQTSAGLDVYVEPVNGMKNLDAQVVVKVGSVHEPDELAGISHALEHSTFLKTPSFPDKPTLRDFADEHAFLRNASTNYVRTRYITRGLDPDAMTQLLAEVTQQAQFGEEAVKNEMNTVQREARTGLDKIDTLSAVFADYVLFGAPYGRSVLGYSDHIDFSEEQLVNFYNRFYKLGNMALVVVGDTTPEIVAGLAEKYFVGDKTPYQETNEPVSVPSRPYPDEKRFGYLRSDTKSARVALSVAVPREFTARNIKSPWAYNAADDLLTREVFNLLRNKLGLSYTAGFNVSSYNHESARKLSAHAIVDPENTDKAITALRSVVEKPARSFEERFIINSLVKQRQYAANEVDNILGRSDAYVDALGYSEPVVSADESYAELQATTLDDVRSALNDILDTWNSSPQLEFVTGPQQAVGDRHVIDQSKFA